VLHRMRISSIGPSRWAPAAAISGVLAGCYAPNFVPPGSPCASATECPTDQRCVAGSCSDGLGRTVDAGAPVPVPDGPPPSDAGSAATCQTSDTCATATKLGMVSGDTDSRTLTAQGNRAAWFRVRVTEDDPFSDGSMHVLATLTPPAGEDFDVRVYVNAGTDVLECTNATGMATTSGTAKEVRASWQDVSNDASRDVSIEVRPLSGSCSPTASWQLVIEGNVN
jgi:hypothetical protein